MKCKRCGVDPTHQFLEWGYCQLCLCEIVAEWEARLDEPIALDPVYTDVERARLLNEAKEVKSNGDEESSSKARR